jgi:protein SCO1
VKCTLSGTVWGRLLVLSLLLTWSVGCTASSSQTASSSHPVSSSQMGVGQAAAGASGFHGAYLPEPYTMPDASLIDTSGRPYNLRTSPSGLVTLLFFGYTHCPDVCISVLSDMAIALSRMNPAERQQIQMIVVTTDPARDSASVMRRYVDRFDPSFVGLTGSLTTIKAVADRVGVDIEGMKRLPSGGYEVGHSAQVIGFDKQHQGVVVWTPSTPIAELKSDFELLVSRQQ